MLPRIADRGELARLLASADALVHGCEAETFCMVAAEARASGIPLIVPDRGAAFDQLVPGAGDDVIAAASESSLERAIGRFIERGPELQRAGSPLDARASGARSMDEHFAELLRPLRSDFERRSAIPSAASGTRSAYVRSEARIRRSRARRLRDRAERALRSCHSGCCAVPTSRVSLTMRSNSSPCGKPASIQRSSICS